MVKKEGRIQERWSFDAGSHLLCGPNVVDLAGDGNEFIIIGTKNGKVILLDGNANPKWEFSVNEKVDDVEAMFMDSESMNSIVKTPNACDIDGDGVKEIVFGTELGLVYALSADGKLLWKYDAKGAVGGISFCDTTGDGKQDIIFGSTDNRLHVLNSQGKLLWDFNVGRSIQSTPGCSASAKFIVFGDNEGHVNCVSFDSKVLWTYKTEGKVIAEPIIEKIKGDDEYILVGSSDSTLYSLDINGSLDWSFKTGGSIISRVKIIDINKDGKQEILLTSCDNNVFLLSCEGDRIWSYETNFWIGSPAVVFDIDGDERQEVAVGSYDHNIYFLAPEGNYVLEHIPGLSNIINQAGHYSEIQTQEPGENIGKRIWQYHVPDMVMGMACLNKIRNLVVSVKTGKVLCLNHVRS